MDHADIPLGVLPSGEVVYVKNFLLREYGKEFLVRELINPHYTKAGRIPPNYHSIVVDLSGNTEYWYGETFEDAFQNYLKHINKKKEKENEKMGDFRPTLFP